MLEMSGRERSKRQQGERRRNREAEILDVAKDK